MMKLNGKKAAKLAGVACAAAGIVALSALVASGAAVAAVKEGFKAAGETVKKVMKEQKQTEPVDGGTLTPDEAAGPAPAEENGEPREETSD